MGNSINKKKNQPLGVHNQIEKDTNCPICGQVMKGSTTYFELNRHVDSCTKNKANEKLKELFKELKDTNNQLNQIENFVKKTPSDKKYSSRSNNQLTIVSSTNFNNFPSNSNTTAITSSHKPKPERIASTQNIFFIDNLNGMLVFKPGSKVKSKKNNNKQSHSNPDIEPEADEFDHDYVSSLPFDDKVSHFKKSVRHLKVDWREGSCTLELNRDQILKQSVDQINKINLYKELKINFKGEVSHDAGGIIREWYTVLFKEIQSPSEGYFQRGDTSDVSYIINQNLVCTMDNLDLFCFLGKILAKAFLENLTVNACFNKIIYKLLLDEKITLDDLVFIDKPLYHSLRELKKNSDLVETYSLYFIVQYHKNGVLLTDELVPNGHNILVTKDNLDEYIQKRIEHIQLKDKVFINEMKIGLFSLIEEKYIKIFNSNELELLLNGQPYIDTYDWKLNTTYKGYSENDVIIYYLWETLGNKTQEELSKFLQFCTGSSRVPIGGFSSLESNRGQISPFCVTKCEYNTNKYIRAHTCFNRLDLPNFPNRKLLEQAVDFVLKNEILGFGID